MIDGADSASLDDAFNGRGVKVEVLNVLGAGDAFSAGFLSGWVRGEDYDACCRYANACGALVVSRHGCAPAMPTRIELDHYLANAERIPQPDQDAALTRLHRVTAPRTPRAELFVFAFDHRDQFFELARAPAPDERRIAGAEAAPRARGRGNGGGARAPGSRRAALRRPLRPGRAQRGDRPRLVDRPAGRAAGLESASSSSTDDRSARR